MGSLYFSIIFSLCKGGVLSLRSFQKKKGKKAYRELQVMFSHALETFFFFGGGGRVEGLRLASAIPKRRACFQDDNTTDWFLQ